MENIENKNTSFVVVVIGAEHVEATPYWEAEASRRWDLIADAVVAFCDKHGVGIDRVTVRTIDS